MAKFEVTSRLTHRSLMNKTKSELATEVILISEAAARLRREVAERLRKFIEVYDDERRPADAATVAEMLIWLGALADELDE